MRCSSIICVILFLAVTCQARRQECACGLGGGTNPCTCGEVVVKAAKLPKPTAYACPQTIKDAATVRSAYALLPHAPLVNSGSYSSSSSSSSSSSASSSSSSSSSSSGSYGIFGNLRANYVSPLIAPPPESSDCGCGRKHSAPLEVRDLLTNNARVVVPRFPPIGDLCYPIKTDPRTGSIIQTTTKVTPAHPGKVKCTTCGSPTPLENCVHIGSANGGSHTQNSERLIAGQNVGGIFGILGGSQGNGATFRTGIYGGSSSSSSSTASSSSSSSASSSSSSSASRTYGNIAGIKTSSFCDEDEPQLEDLSPRLPADPVSLTLAYKNLFPPAIIHKQGKKFIPEDKLAFGHRTVPTDVKTQKNVPDIPEEKLQTVDRPVVELKTSPPAPITIGTYDDHEEENLAELEAMERERIDQEQDTQQTGSFITYRELGYAPIDTTVSRTFITSTNADMATHDSGNKERVYVPEGPCGPLGPPIEGYVPGNVIVHQEVVESEDEQPRDVEETYYGDSYFGDDDEDDDDIDTPRSGFLARLRSIARKPSSFCPH